MNITRPWDPVGPRQLCQFSDILQHGKTHIINEKEDNTKKIVYNCIKTYHPDFNDLRVTNPRANLWDRSSF